MAFDAGAVMAHLDVDLNQFDRKLTAAEERVRKFERDKHTVRLDAVFDNASVGRAAAMFRRLDDQISREAMQRLKSGPQGSILGSLNALFSPHQLAGAPSPKASASQGLLGRIVNSPGGGGASGPLNPAARTIGSVIAGSTSTASNAQVNQAAAAAGNQAGQTFASRFSSHLTGLFSGGGGGGGGGGGFLGSYLGSRGGASSAATGLAKGIGPGILGIGARNAGIVGLGASALGAVPALAGGLAPALPLGIGVGALGLLNSGIGQTLSPLTARYQAIQQAQQFAVTPAQQKAVAAQQAGLNQAVAQLSPALKAIYNAKNQLSDTWQNFTANLAPLLVKPFQMLAGLLTSLQGPMTAFFTGAAKLAVPLIQSMGDLARQVLPLLAQAFAATAPVVRPLIDGIGSLITGLLPGLITLIKASAPAVAALGHIFGEVGSAVGQMLATFAPAIQASVPILKALFDVLAAVFPIIGQLAAIMARALGPVFTQFAGVIRALLPFLVTIGKVLAALAGAVLTDLVAAFGALAQLLVAISPALSAFAQAFSKIFVVLENTGIFAVLGSAIEALVKPLAAVINALLRGLTPLLPPIIKFLSQLSSVLVGALVQAVLALLPPLTQLATVALQSLAIVLPVLLPLLVKLTQIFTAALVRVITDLATALSAVINAIPPKLLNGLIIGILAIVGALKAWAAIQAILDISITANPIGLLIIAVAALAIGVVELVKHWRSVWSEVKTIGADVGHFLNNLFRNHVVQDILAVWSLGLIPLAEHWKTVWANIQAIAQGFRNWLHQVFGTDIANFFTHTIPGWWDQFTGFTRNRLINPVKSEFQSLLNWFHQVFGTDISNFFTRTVPSWFDTSVRGIGRFWGGIENAVRGPVKFVIDNVLDGLISVFDTIVGAVGLGSLHINQVHPMGLAAGGKITAGTGPTADDVLVRVSKDETVVSAAHSKQLAPLFAMLGIRGYAAGGKVGQPPPVNLHTGVPTGGQSGGPFGGILHKALDIGKMTLAFATGNSAAFTNAFSDILGKGSGGASGGLGQILTAMPKLIARDLVSWIMGQGSGASGNAIADYAASFIGKIPYVWGGTAVPGGADCSGFTQAIYKHFGISAPRTSESQGSWVKRGPAVPGGLAFYNSPAGGPPPGHVAIVRNARQVISQGGGMGPQLMAMNGLPLMFTGTPPGGLGAADKGGLFLGPGGSYQNDIQLVLRSLGLPLSLTANWLRQIQTESGGQLNAVNRTDINAQMGHPSVGLLQLIPDTFHRYAGPYVNTPPLVNYGGGTVSENAMAQIYAAIHYANDVYHGAAMDQVIGRGHGYAKGGVIREPVIGFGTRSGEPYSFGERGPEWVTPAGPGGSAPSGQLAGTINLMLPEGVSVARALNELSFWLKVAQQQGYAGVLPGG